MKIVWRDALPEESYDSYTGGKLVRGEVIHVCKSCKRVVTERTQQDLVSEGKTGCFGCGGTLAQTTAP
jgi:hypothetical protein